VDRYSNEDFSPKNRSDRLGDFLLDKSAKRKNSQHPRLFPLRTPSHQPNNPNNLNNSSNKSLNNGERAKVWNTERGMFRTPPTATSIPPSPQPAKKKARSRRSQPASVRSSVPPKTTSRNNIRENRRSQTIRARNRPSVLSKIVPASLSCLRFLVIACGVWAIVGTTVYIATSQSLQRANKEKQTQQKPTGNVTPKTQKSISAQIVDPSNTPEVEIDRLDLTSGQESTTLKNKLVAVGKKYTTIEPHAFFYELDGKTFVNLSGDTPVAAASTIKIPILIAFFQDVDSGKIKLDEMLTMTKEMVATGSGDMQYQKVGKKFSALETATKTIVISDNTATNMLIAKLGGKDSLNRRFASWGLEHTVIRNVLPDLEGTNTTSPMDLVKNLTLLERGDLVSARSRDRILEIMRETKTRTLLPQGIEKDASIAHKTGDIGKILGDAGIVDMPDGKRYIVSIMAKRPHNAVQGRLLIQEFSKTAYQHFKYTATRPQESFTE
jgi:beta-lactamase class A